MSSAVSTMHLQVMLPERVVLNRAVRNVVAEGLSGSFALLPRHIDFVESLVPGILMFVPAEEDTEQFVAVDEGILVKCGREVLVSVRNAVMSAELGVLEQAVRQRFHRVDDREQAMRSALAKLEADVVRRFIEME